MRISKRELILLILLILTGIIYLFYTYMYGPVRDKTDALQVENTRLETAILTEQKSIETINNLEEEKLKHDYQVMAEKIPESPFIPEIIDYLEKSAEDAGVELLAVTYTETNKKDRQQNKDNSDQEITGPEKLRFQATTCGSYPELLLFLLRIEKNSRIYVVEGSKMKTSKRKVIMPPAMAAEGESPTLLPPPVILTGSSGYDPENIVMDIMFNAYYDKNSLPDISGAEEKVKPGDGRTNPFAK